MNPRAPTAPRRLSPGVRVLLAIAGLVLLTMLVTVGVAAAAIHRAGTISVDVAPEDGTRLSVNVPAGLANLAITFVPRSALREMAGELGPVLPALVTGYEQVERAPDFTLVDARDGEQHVLVRKEGRRLIVRVTSDDERIDVALPLSTIREILEKFDGIDSGG